MGGRVYEIPETVHWRRKKYIPYTIIPKYPEAHSITYAEYNVQLSNLCKKALPQNLDGSLIGESAVKR